MQYAHSHKAGVIRHLLRSTKNRISPSSLCCVAGLASCKSLLMSSYCGDVERFFFLQIKHEEKRKDQSNRDIPTNEAVHRVQICKIESSIKVSYPSIPSMSDHSPAMRELTLGGSSNYSSFTAAPI